MISKIGHIRTYISTAPHDDNTGALLAYLSELEKEVKSKKYGLVFEEHREGIGKDAITIDIFKSGRTIYHIDRVVRETKEVADNGFHEIYANKKVNDGTEIAELMQYIKKTKGINKKFPKTSERVRYFKEEKEGVEIMCEIIEEYAQQRAKEAAKENSEQIAFTMLDDGMDESMIIKYIGLTELQMKNIRNKRKKR